jgi:hypothetical protein
VFYGYDHEYSETVDAEPPLDVLDGGPAWLPWTPLATLATEDRLGWCFWYEAGRWQRSADVARRDVRDGHRQAIPGVLSDENAVRELSGWVMPRDRRGATPTDAVEAFARLAGQPVPDAVARAMTVAGAAGLTPGSSSPLERPAGPDASRPPRRRRRISEAEHERLIWDAMRAATEAPRPVTPAKRHLKRLAGWLHKRGHLHPGGPGIGFQICAGGSTVQGMDAVGFDDFEVIALAGRLREAEADRAYGRWIWALLSDDGREVTLTRAFDHLPVWWATQPQAVAR